MKQSSLLLLIPATKFIIGFPNSCNSCNSYLPMIKAFKNTLLEKGVPVSNRPIELWSNSVINRKIDYIHNNQVVEGLVFRAEDYIYSSAADYAGEKGLLEVIVIK